MRIPKRYGESKIDDCPFCGKQSTTRNPQNVPVCKEHKEKDMPNLRCVCGTYLDLRFGRYGPFYNCMKCGNMNMSRAMEMNPDAFRDEQEEIKNKEREKKMYFSQPEKVDPDDPRYFD
ncbi:MAG: hypothetical protein ACLFNK_05540 [Candidatus Woesearchaeota archaeon]